jgi:hypothetical protein
MLSRRQVSELIDIIREKMSVVAQWIGLNEPALLNWEYNGVTILKIYLSRSGALVHRFHPFTRTKEVAAIRSENYKEVKKAISLIIREVAEDLVMDLFSRKYEYNYDLGLRFTLESDFSWKFIIEENGKTRILAEGKENETPIKAFPVIAKICAIQKL